MYACVVRIMINVNIYIYIQFLIILQTRNEHPAGTTFMRSRIFFHVWKIRSMNAKSGRRVKV